MGKNLADSLDSSTPILTLEERFVGGPKSGNFSWREKAKES